jgi:hypothetical protein
MEIKVKKKSSQGLLRELRSYYPQARKLSANEALAIKKGSKLKRNYIIGFIKKTKKQRKKII